MILALVRPTDTTMTTTTTTTTATVFLTYNINLPAEQHSRFGGH